MSTAVKRRRGTRAENAAFTGQLGEWTQDTTLNTIRVHDGATAGGHPLARMADQGINVKLFGAVGDDATDNFAALTAALATVVDGSILYFPPGIYRCSNSLTIAKINVLLTGPGESFGYNPATPSVVLKFTGGTTGIIMDKAFGQVGNSDFSMIRNMTIDGNDTLSYGIRWTGNKKFYGVQVKKCNLAGFYCENHGNSWSMVECSALLCGPTGAGVGLLVGENDTTIFHVSRCVFRQNYQGIKIVQAINFHFIDCVIEANKAEGVYMKNTDATGSLAAGIFDNCWAESNCENGGGKYAWHMETAATSGSFYLQGITFRNCRMGADNAAHKAIYVGVNCTRILFERNRYGGNSTSDIKVEATAVDVVFSDSQDDKNITYGSVYSKNFANRLASGAVQRTTAAATEIMAVGQQPALVTIPNGATMTFTLKGLASAADCAAILLLYAPSSGRAAIILLAGSFQSVISDTAGLFEINAAPTTKIGISMAANVVSMKNATGASRAVSIHVLGNQITSVTDPV